MAFCLLPSGAGPARQAARLAGGRGPEPRVAAQLSRPLAEPTCSHLLRPRLTSSLCPNPRSARPFPPPPTPFFLLPLPPSSPHSGKAKKGGVGACCPWTGLCPLRSPDRRTATLPLSRLQIGAPSAGEARPPGKGQGPQTSVTKVQRDFQPVLLWSRRGFHSTGFTLLGILGNVLYRESSVRVDLFWFCLFALCC